jgi:anti-sigma-K factor RskA
MAAAAADLEDRTRATDDRTMADDRTRAVDDRTMATDDRTRAVAVPPAEPAPPATPVPFPGPAEREARRGRAGAGTWILRIAAVVAIAVLGINNVLLRMQLDSSQAYEASVAAVLDAAAEPGSLTAILTADGGTGSGLAALSTSGEVTMAMRDLAPTSGEQVYETWVIGSDGVPLPIGGFKVDRSGVASFEGSGPPSPAGTVVALTLEPGPGATVPTGPIISKGVATAVG